MTLLNIQFPSPASPSVSVHDSSPPRSLLVYVPLAVAIILILLPHPSWAIMLSSHYLTMRRAPVAFWTHLLTGYFLTFMVFSSLMTCVVRDPGRVTPASPQKKTSSGWTESGDEEEVSVALLGGEEEEDRGADTSGTRWCRRCRLRRPERAHHCSTCGRCILKMDHHCPWLGGNCIGYRTYPSFVHFVFSTTLLAAYITSVSLYVLVQLVSDPFTIDPQVTPLHSLFLVFMGATFTLTMGSFLLYHVYLISTNQTTLEHISPFLLLRYFPGLPRNTDDIHTTPERERGSPPYPQSHPSPSSNSQVYPPHPTSSPKRRPPPPLPSSYSRIHIPTELAEPPSPTSQSSPLSPPHPHLDAYPLHPTPPYTAPPSSSTSTSTSSLSPPLEEHELSAAQRRVVQHAHRKLRPYDLGFRANWAQVFGGARRGWTGWTHLLLWGGTPRGDGRAFARGPGVQSALERLSRELDAVRRQERRGH